MEPLSIFFAPALALVALLIGQFAQVEMLRVILRLQQMPRPKTGRMHLIVFLCNFATLGWMTLMWSYRVGLMSAMGGISGPFGGGFGMGAAFMSLAPGGLEWLIMLAGYLMILALTLQNLLYAPAIPGKIPPGVSPESGSELSFRQAILTAFLSAGLAALLTTLFFLLIAVAIGVLSSLRI